MTTREIAFFTGCLVLMGAGWGLTQPLTKIAVSTGYGHFGLVFWQQVLAAVLLGGFCLMRGFGLPMGLSQLRVYAIIAMIGTVIPNTLSYQAAVHLPAGIMSLLLSVIPMFSFAIALMLGNDRFAFRRLAGLLMGLMGVLIIVAPAVDLGQPIPVPWAIAYLVTALFYAFEGNYLAKWGTAGLNPFQVMLGASLLGLVVIVPLVLGSGQYIAPLWPMPMPQVAQILASLLHIAVYVTYVFLSVRAGAVFTAQVSYMVTGFGLLWAYLILGEAYAATLWLALGTIFAGMYLVQPRGAAKDAAKDVTKDVA